MGKWLLLSEQGFDLGKTGRRVGRDSWPCALRSHPGWGGLSCAPAWLRTHCPSARCPQQVTLNTHFAEQKTEMQTEAAERCLSGDIHSQPCGPPQISNVPAPWELCGLVTPRVTPNARPAQNLGRPCLPAPSDPLRPGQRDLRCNQTLGSPGSTFCPAPVGANDLEKTFAT